MFALSVVHYSERLALARIGLGAGMVAVAFAVSDIYNRIKLIVQLRSLKDVLHSCDVDRMEDGTELHYYASVLKCRVGVVFSKLCLETAMSCMLLLMQVMCLVLMNVTVFTNPIPLAPYVLILSSIVLSALLRFVWVARTVNQRVWLPSPSPDGRYKGDRACDVMLEEIGGEEFFLAFCRSYGPRIERFNNGDRHQCDFYIRCYMSLLRRAKQIHLCSRSAFDDYASIEKQFMRRILPEISSRIPAGSSPEDRLEFLISAVRSFRTRLTSDEDSRLFFTCLRVLRRMSRSRPLKINGVVVDGRFADSELEEGASTELLLAISTGFCDAKSIDSCNDVVAKLRPMLLGENESRNIMETVYDNRCLFVILTRLILDGENALAYYIVRSVLYMDIKKGYSVTKSLMKLVKMCPNELVEAELSSMINRADKEVAGFSLVKEELAAAVSNAGSMVSNIAPESVLIAVESVSSSASDIVKSVGRSSRWIARSLAGYVSGNHSPQGDADREDSI